MEQIAFARWHRQPPLAPHPGVDYAAYAVGPAGPLPPDYYYIEQIGWDDKPRPSPHRRRPAPVDMWTESLETLSGTYADQTFQNPPGQAGARRGRQ